MNIKAKTCDSCNSEIITVKRGKCLVAECSYCGKPSDLLVDAFPEEDE